MTRAPVDCMCRPCNSVDEKLVQPQELLNLVSKGVDIDNVPNL